MSAGSISEKICATRLHSVVFAARPCYRRRSSCCLAGRILRTSMGHDNYLHNCAKWCWTWKDRQTESQSRLTTTIPRFSVWRVIPLSVITGRILEVLVNLSFLLSAHGGNEPGIIRRITSVKYAYAVLIMQIPQYQHQVQVVLSVPWYGISA